ncbi:MAG TPA: GNAT family N-acetyltransferase [Casimicrobiaceae bacterium]|nr:GNAT family N-acetyltransferase [Casimicrobiaceae bacterium]
MAVTCRQAQPNDFPALGQMLELYQYELSDILQQDLGADGRYGYDLARHREGTRFYAHVAFEADHYAGFALVAPAAITRTDGSWMEQFFILKRYRRAGAGRALAFHVLNSHPGPWEVGEMPDNATARAFWRKVIAEATAGTFTEMHVTEGSWQGTVQRFHLGGLA